MCGIVVGLSFGKLNKRDEDIRQRLLRYFTTELILATEERGKDATGAAVLFDDGKYYGLKRGERSTDYLAVFGESKERYGSLLKVWREHEAYSRVYLGHCRAGTVGDKEDNENNHPIKVGNLIGIHNGVIRNHKEIIENLGCKRDGEVDSEAIFRLFDHYTNKGKEPFTIDMIQSVVDRLEGQFAITLFNADNVSQVPVFRDGRPVEFVLLRKYGILLMVSELKFWNRIHYRYERMAHYYEELAGIKMPRFLQKGDIVKKMLPDDSAMIFDLTKKVDASTMIDDLGEYKKMERSNKMWQIKTTAASKSYHYGYQSPYEAAKKKADDEKKGDLKRRVFDRITRQYIIMDGDKELADDKSTTLPVDKEEKVAATAALATVNKADPEEPVTKEDKDDAPQKKSSVPIEIDDKTNYSESTVGKGTASAGAKDVTIVEVDMSQPPKEVIKAAKEAYDALPVKKKGYGNMEDIISAVDIKDEQTADSMGMVLVTNRTFKVNWQDGFMAGCMAAMETDDSDRGVHKAKQRESHIASLKSMILLLAKFYDSSKGAGNSNAFDKIVEQRMAQAVRHSKIELDIKEVSKLFNSHEQELIADVGEAIAKAKE